MSLVCQNTQSLSKSQVPNNYLEIALRIKGYVLLYNQETESRTYEPIILTSWG